MELRRPRLADKETVLEMMAEFEKSQSAHDGGFWDAENFVYEEWLEENLQAEAGLNIPENWVPAIQLVSFDVAGQALGFLISYFMSCYFNSRTVHVFDTRSNFLVASINHRTCLRIP